MSGEQLIYIQMHVNPASLEEEEGGRKKTSVMNLQTLGNTYGKKVKWRSLCGKKAALIANPHPSPPHPPKKPTVLIKADAAGGNTTEMQSANTH